MDLITADMEHISASTDAFHFATVPYPEHDHSSPHDSIASLMQMAEKMDTLLPLDCPLSRKPLSDALFPPSLAAPRPLSKTLPPALKLEPDMYPRTDDPSGRLFLSSIAAPAGCAPSAAAAAAPSALLSPAALPAALSPCSVRELPCTPSPRAPPSSSCSTLTATTTGSGSGSTTTGSAAAAAPAPQRRARVSKPVRKPKTYSKPVASRFCHICSRTPRRGHGAAVCARMRDGLCRKIVCEQCIREQGWAFDRIRANPDIWHCPHCADACPPRSQCHIYNRINARRKRVTPVTAPPSAAAPPPPPAPPAGVARTAHRVGAAAGQALADTPAAALYSWP